MVAWDLEGHEQQGLQKQYIVVIGKVLVVEIDAAISYNSQKFRSNFMFQLSKQGGCMCCQNKWVLMLPKQGLVGAAGEMEWSDFRHD